jgi:hypothetical protein
MNSESTRNISSEELFCQSENSQSVDRTASLMPATSLILFSKRAIDIYRRLWVATLDAPTKTQVAGCLPARIYI